MVVAESGPGLALREGERLRESPAGSSTRRIAASATAGARLDHQRIADPLRLAREQRRVLLLPRIAWDDRQAGLDRRRLALRSCCPSG